MTKWNSLLERLGEQIVFGDTTVHASLKESTKSLVSLASRADTVEGQCSNIAAAVSVGSYFKRPADMNADYFVTTIMAEPLAADVLYIFACKCNATVDIQRQASIQGDFETIHSGVLCWRDQVNRSERDTADGSINQTIYTLTLPHGYMLSKGDRVVMKGNVGGVYANENYQVESVSSVLVGVDGNGVDVAQLSYDMRY